MCRVGVIGQGWVVVLPLPSTKSLIGQNFKLSIGLLEELVGVEMKTKETRERIYDKNGNRDRKEVSILPVHERWPQTQVLVGLISCCLTFYTWW